MSPPPDPTRPAAPSVAAGASTRDPAVAADTGPPPAPAGPETIPHAGSEGLPYADLTPHARGGLGEVFRATDPELHRSVAVKRIRPDRADDPASRRRFVIEAEVTARLDHPGVVPVYRLFTDDTGRPGYAMRFVEGSTFWDAIRGFHAGPTDPVTFRRLLQCFLQVCQAVAYAHSRGVIHRDLKPQNVMLGRFGETLVVDWGLAKVVGRPEATGTAGEDTLVPSSGSGHETQMGSAVGTPAFMSPEQAAGRWDVVDHLSDVYALGAVLYAVLTGRPPLESGNWPELQQRIQQGDFPHPRQVRPAVPRALEAVCLRAMAVRPADRYPSALDLAADVEHWLADEPVSAYREPLAARGRRWARKRRTLVTATAALLVTALVAAGAGLVLLGQKNREVADQRNAARLAADEAEALNAFLTDDLLGQADPDLNPFDEKVTVVQLLARASGRIDGNAKFAGRPTVEATLRVTIGQAMFKLDGDNTEVERHLTRAVDLRRTALGPDAPLTLAAQDALADFLARGLERFGDAEPLARGTWEVSKRVLGPDHRATLNALDTYASAVEGLGRSNDALALRRQCLDGRRKALGPDDPDTLQSLNNLGRLLSHRGEWGEAVAVLREAVVGWEGRGVRSDSLPAIGNLSLALYQTGELKDADALLTKYIPVSTRLLSAAHPSTQHLRAFQARVWLERGRATEALPELQTVVAGRRRAFPNGNWRIGSGLVDQGRALLAVGRRDEAVTALAEARDVYQKTPPPNDYYAAWADAWYGAALAAVDRRTEAAELMTRAEGRLRAAPACPSRHHRLVLESLVGLYESWGKPDEAAKWKRRLNEAAGPNGVK